VSGFGHKPSNCVGIMIKTGNKLVISIIIAKLPQSHLFRCVFLNTKGKSAFSLKSSIFQSRVIKLLYI
jgi:hypothetical protein